MEKIDTGLAFSLFRGEKARMEKNHYSLENSFCIASKSVSKERIIQLANNLEAHQRFWNYLAYFECLCVDVRSFKSKKEVNRF